MSIPDLRALPHPQALTSDLLRLFQITDQTTFFLGLGG